MGAGNDALVVAQVWMVAESIAGFPSETPGAVCHRLGVGPMQPRGQSWDCGIGVSVTHVLFAVFFLCQPDCFHLLLREDGSTSV